MYRWYFETGAVLLTDIAALAGVWLGWSLSNSFQERAILTGAFAMRSRRTSTSNHRAEC
ncbi:hypothetical protein L917_14668, partial [Phytophthora nicotianae]